MNGKLLVTGASGHFGQLVLNHLVNTLNIPANRIVAASRSVEKLADWAKQGVETRAVDFEQSSTFAAAFAGIERALLISTDALDKPGRRLAQHQNAIQGLEAAGVQHLVYTSAPNPDNSPLLIAPDHAGTEKALASSQIPSWTILRNHWYFENLFASLPSAIAMGQWFAADDNQGNADISRSDLALAAAVALSNNSAEKNTYTLSGAESLTKQDMAAVVSAVINKPIEVVQVPLEGLVQGMVGAGMPEAIARVYASFDTNTAAGKVATVTHDFEQLTGRKPQSFKAWVAAHQAMLAAL